MKATAAAVVQSTAQLQPGNVTLGLGVVVAICWDIKEARHYEAVAGALQNGGMRRVMLASDGAIDGPKCYADASIVAFVQANHPRAEWHVTEFKVGSLQGIAVPLFVATVHSSPVAMVAPCVDGVLGSTRAQC